MEINDFSEASSFAYNESLKMLETFGIKKVPEKRLEFFEKRIDKYVKLYDKPFFEQEKRRIQLKAAFDTMPHGFWWKFFHAKLWKKMKYIMEHEEFEQKEKAQEAEETSENNAIVTSAVPVIIQPVAVPVPSQVDSGEDLGLG